jgi:hypothetical protein
VALEAGCDCHPRVGKSTELTDTGAAVYVLSRLRVLARLLARQAAAVALQAVLHHDTKLVLKKITG